jgi:gamma-glutamyl hydrolase
MDPGLFDAAGTEPLAMNNHHKGASPAQLAQNARLAATFTLLSTNHDRGGRAFVSTVEGQGGLPVWGVQWHPEKNVFEWGTVPDPATGEALPYEGINHSPTAQALTRYTGEFFVAHARRSAHAFPSQQEEEAALMYNYAAVPSGPEFVQSYYFRGYPAYDVYSSREEEEGEVVVQREERRRQQRVAAGPPSLRGA